MDPFGNVVPQKGRHGSYIRNVQNNLRFPGQYYDAESGLHQNWHRDYDPKLGRYLEADPIGFDGGDANLYAYVRNSPLALADPMGLLCCPSWRESAIRQFSADDINYGARVVYAEASCDDDDRFGVSSVLLNRIGAKGIRGGIKYTLVDVANAPGQFEAVFGNSPKFVNSSPVKAGELNNAECNSLNKAITILSVSIFVGRPMYDFDEFRAAGATPRPGWTRLGGNDFQNNPGIYVK